MYSLLNNVHFIHFKFDNMNTHFCYRKLSLNTNMIEKINGLAALRHLKILSLGRNYIKAFTGLEPLADTLEELWISYNFIEKMKGVLGMRKLKVLHMSNNNVKEWAEVNKLAEMESLKDFLFVGKLLYKLYTSLINNNIY